MAKSNAKIKPQPLSAIYRDHEARTCIRLDETRYIPMTIEGFEIQTTSPEFFEARYKPLPNYPLEKACQLFIGYAKTLGASKEVAEYLNTIVPIGLEVQQAIVAKFASRTVESIKQPKAPKAEKARKEKKPKVGEKSVEPKKPKPKGESASSLFQQLIMEGNLPDHQIFLEVQKKFGLSDDKKSYVSWYRKKLIKDGKNPPPAQ